MNVLNGRELVEKGKACVSRMVTHTVILVHLKAVVSRQTEAGRRLKKKRIFQVECILPASLAQ